LLVLLLLLEVVAVRLPLLPVLVLDFAFGRLLLFVAVFDVAGLP
jgi:hypothetical protein